MAFWDRKPREERDAPLIKEEAITPPVDDVLLSALLKNETITREKALTLPVVSGAVDFIANTIASMPIKLYKERDGSRGLFKMSSILHR